MAKKSRNVFETDRRMELRMRLAMNQVEEPAKSGPSQIDTKPLEREVVDRVIDRVRRL
jgi:hypothetical protein